MAERGTLQWMRSAGEGLKVWWRADRLRRWLLVGTFLYISFMMQGVPLWDDDFTSWHWKVKDHSLFKYLLEILSPISTQPQHWGFNERPVQAFVYKFFYYISGYDAWSYFLFKNAVLSGVAVLIYTWGLRLVPRSPEGQLAAFAAALFFVLTQGPVAAQLLFQDFAVVAEMILLLLTYLTWQAIEDTPPDWRWLSNPSDPAMRRWFVRWLGLCGIAYLGFKTKADVKLFPFVLVGYVLLIRPRQWALFLLPATIMILLAVPWGPGIFTKLPPFIPGSAGSEIGWMWQPASFDRLLDFLWTRGGYDFGVSMRAATISLSGLLGPFLLLGMIGFIIWKATTLPFARTRPYLLASSLFFLCGLSALSGAHLILSAKGASESDLPLFLGLLGGILLLGEIGLLIRKAQYREEILGILLSSPVARARTFVLVWFLVLLCGMSALSAINYSFRIRYAILHMLPASLLLAWVFGLFVASRAKLPLWATIGGLAVFSIQAGINLNRSITYRRDMGQVLVAVDQAYEYLAKNFPDAKLALLPDFRPYDYRPGAGKIFLEKEWLGSTDDLPKKHTPFKTYTISWSPSLWAQLDLVEHFSGCRSTSLFDLLFSCPPGTGAHLMKYIGPDVTFDLAETARSKGDLATARRLYDDFVARYPWNLGAHFSLGLTAFQQRDFARSIESYNLLEHYFPNHMAILYNYALALAEAGKYLPAVERLKFVILREPTNYAALINLYWTYRKAEKKSRARETILKIQKLFPNDAEVAKLVAQ